jgi:hypothetical protein
MLNVLCKRDQFRDVPCLAHMELGSGPLHPEHLPPSLSAWGNGDSVYQQPLTRMDLDSGVEIRKPPNTDPVTQIMLINHNKK